MKRAGAKDIVQKLRVHQRLKINIRNQKRPQKYLYTYHLQGTFHDHKVWQGIKVPAPSTRSDLMR